MRVSWARLHFRKQTPKPTPAPKLQRRKNNASVKVSVYLALSVSILQQCFWLNRSIKRRVISLLLTLAPCECGENIVLSRVGGMQLVRAKSHNLSLACVNEKVRRWQLLYAPFHEMFKLAIARPKQDWFAHTHTH